MTDEGFLSAISHPTHNERKYWLIQHIVDRLEAMDRQVPAEMWKDIENSYNLECVIRELKGILAESELMTVLDIKRQRDKWKRMYLERDKEYRKAVRDNKYLRDRNFELGLKHQKQMEHITEQLRIARQNAEDKSWEEGGS